MVRATCSLLFPLRTHTHRRHFRQRAVHLQLCELLYRNWLCSGYVTLLPVEEKERNHRSEFKQSEKKEREYTLTRTHKKTLAISATKVGFQQRR